MFNLQLVMAFVRCDKSRLLEKLSDLEMNLENNKNCLAEILQKITQ